MSEEGKDFWDHMRDAGMPEHLIRESQQANRIPKLTWPQMIIVVSFLAIIMWVVGVGLWRWLT